MTTEAGALVLREATGADRPFLRGLYATTRELELRNLPFTPDQRAAFLTQQFEAHRRSLEARAGLRDAVVLVDGERAGRIATVRGPDELRVVDLALLPAFRGRGVGTAILVGLGREADAVGIPVTLSVERDNPAGRLYARLGFVPIAVQPADGVRIALRRRPSGDAPS